MTEWKRREWTTKCSDPTVVVEWSLDLGNGLKFEITEFQNVYQVRIGTFDSADPLDPLVKGGYMIHQQLEQKEWDQLFANAEAENAAFPDDLDGPPEFNNYQE